jgi:hypothetical protein
VIDEVRIYDRALSRSEIEGDMSTPVPRDTTPPTPPESLTAMGSSTSVLLSWTASSDAFGVIRYNVHRGTSPGFVPTSANRVGQPTGTSFVDAGLGAGTYFYRLTAEDGAGNVSAPSNEASATAAGDTTPPAVSVSTPVSGGRVLGTVTVAATASDDDAVAGVQFQLDGANLGAEDTSAPYALPWDTRTAADGSHVLTAVARDRSGNRTTATPVTVTVDNAAPPPGLVAAYGFEEGSGSATADGSGRGKSGTVVGASWTGGRFGSALSFDGVDDRVDLPGLGTFYDGAFTYEAWVKKAGAKKDAGLVGTWVSGQQGGPMLWVEYASGRYFLTLNAGSPNYLDSTQSPAVGVWQHVAATYDGVTARFYVDGVEVASRAFSGNVGDSDAWRIGAYGLSASGFFDGVIDEVRIYDRALSRSEIEGDMSTPVPRDTTPPRVTAVQPAAEAIDVPVAAVVTASFDEAMNPATIGTATFELRDAGGDLVPAAVTYDPATRTASLVPASALSYNAVYRATVKGGASSSRATDLSGNALAVDRTWSFTAEPSPPPVLVVTSSANRFSAYNAEILRAEGLSDFATTDISLLSPGYLARFEVVVLGDLPLSAADVAMLTDWVNAGGNLIAMHPDKALAGLLGLTDTGTSLLNGYLRINTASRPGAGLVGETIQFHGTADRYLATGATTIATLYSDAGTTVAQPAVTLRSVGNAGGEAAAFTYDLARSVVYTRQGNPAWAGQERDGVLPIRPDDLFYGAKTGDVQPDWIDVSKIAIPQADEQQRLLANLMLTMTGDRTPLPRFWYLPRGEKAAVVMTGDDHAVGGTAGRFDRYKAVSPSGCSVADWECVRGTSYIYPNSPLTNAQAAAYEGDGFEIALHPHVALPCANWTPAILQGDYAEQLSLFKAKYTSVSAPVTNRMHCVAWSDWATMAKTELAEGVRLDTNYYHYPSAWIGSRPGFLTGSGTVMRFADLDGSTIDVFQAATQMTDEGGQAYPSTVDALLDRALGTEGYYGVFTANMHTDEVSSPGSDAIVASALAHDVPVVSARQMLEWVDGRDRSSFRSFSWDGSVLGFSIRVGAGANGLQAMLPVDAGGKTLASISLGGAPVPFTVQTIKGIEYALFAATAGAYAATYSQ